MTTLGSNTGYFRFDEIGKTMQYISQSHYFQSWALSNTSSYLTNASALPLHQTTMSILAGSVGIGTSTPQATLDINGNMKITSTALVTNLNADKLDGQDGSFYQNAANITSGTLSVSRGGTGLSTIPSNKLMVGNGTSAVLTPTNLHWDGANLGVGTANPFARMHVYGNFLVEMENTPLRISSLNNTSAAPYFYSLGKRVDGNTSYAFGGRLALAKNRMDDATSANSTVGMIAFGGNHTDGGESNIAFSSSIVGISDVSFTNSNTMPTSIAFCTGSTGYSVTTTNINTIGAERMRIHSGGNVGIGIVNPACALDVKGSIRSTNQLISTVGIGTAPLSVASTTLVTNLNADKLDGQDGTYYQNACNINDGVLGVSYGGIGTTVLTTNKLLVGNNNLGVLSPVDLHWSGANLGIGTINPLAKLHVYGNFLVDMENAPLRLSTLNTTSTAPYFYSLGRRSDGNTSYAFAGRIALAKNRTDDVTNANSILGMLAFGGNHTDGGDSNVAFTTSIVGISDSNFWNSNTMPTSIVFCTGSTGYSMTTNNVGTIGAERMRIHSGGNVGIGIVNPIFALDVKGSIRSTGQLISTVGVGTAPLSVDSTTLVANLNADKLDGQDGAYYQNACNINSGILAVSYGGIGTTVLTANKLLVGNNNLGVLSPVDLHWSGANLGIGTTTPKQKLDVVGSIQVSSQLISTVGLGTAPLSVASTTLVANLNADKLDGQDGSYYQNACNINSGVLAVAYGGIGTTVLTANKLLVGNNNLGVLSPADLHWSGANLGIGTTTPKQKLDVTGSIQASSQFISTVGLGTAPLSVASTTLVTNLNADKLDGQDGSYYQNACNINSGVLAVAYGGIGTTVLTANKLLVGNSNLGVLSPVDLHWSGANLGIGTATPTQKLDVAGSIQASSQLISTVGLGIAPLSVASTTLVANLNADKLDGQDGSYYQNATNMNAGTLSVLYGGTGNNTLTANKLLVGNGSNAISSPSNLHWTGANLGIGTSTPVQALDVFGSIQTSQSLISTVATGTSPLQVTSSTKVNNLNADLLDGQDGLYYQNAGNINAGTLAVSYGGTGTTTLTPNKILVGYGTSAVVGAGNLHWDSANNRLGIGQNAPTRTLHVEGDATVTGNAYFRPGSILQWSGTDPGAMIQVFYGGGDAYGFGQYGSGTVRIFGSSVYAGTNFSMCIAHGNNTYTDLFTVNKSGNATLAGGLTCAWINAQSYYTTNLTAYRYYNSSTAANTSGSVNADVSIHSTHRVVGSEFNALSDERAKHNITSLDESECSAIVDQLTPVSFQWKESVDPEDRHIGFIAQSVESVIPQAVRKHFGVIANVCDGFQVVSIDTPVLMKLVPKDNIVMQIGDIAQLYLYDKTAIKGKVVEMHKSHLVLEVEKALTDAQQQAAITHGVYIYGMEVDDARTIDMNTIVATLVGSHKEMMKKLDALQKRVLELEAQMMQA
jgi:hypothetical protein